MICLQNLPQRALHKTGFYSFFLATNLSMTSVFQNVKMSKFHSVHKETLGQRDFRSLSTFNDLLTKSPTEGVAQKLILYSLSCNQFMSSVLLECKNVKIPCNPIKYVDRLHGILQSYKEI